MTTPKAKEASLLTASTKAALTHIRDLGVGLRKEAQEMGETFTSHHVNMNIKDRPLEVLRLKAHLATASLNNAELEARLAKLVWEMDRRKYDTTLRLANELDHVAHILNRKTLS